MRHIVGTVAELPPGSRRIVEVAGRSIGVFNVGGEFFALRNSCPHQGGPLCVGHLTGFVTATAPGVYDYSREGEILRCPWHGWEFDVRTGRSWFDPSKVRVRRYEVAVMDAAPVSSSSSTEAVKTETEAAETDVTPPAPGLEPGPYVAETYAVSVEESYVVVDVPT